MDTDISDVSTDRDDVLADIKGSRIAHTFHGDIDTTTSVTSLIKALISAISLEQMVVSVTLTTASLGGS